MPKGNKRKSQSNAASARRWSKTKIPDERILFSSNAFSLLVPIHII